MVYTIELSEEKMNLVIGALAELPAKTSMNLISELQISCQKQQIAAKANEGAE